MSTIRQIQANQLNAQQSTGPRSVEGKAVVAMNAFKSGLDAKSVIIRGESPADFETLTSEWLNRRYLRLEAQLWEDCMPSPERLRPTTFLSQALSSGDYLFDKLARHKNSALRNYHIALRDLERLKKEEHKQELAATSPEPVAANSAPIGPLLLHPIDPPPTSTPIGFVPSNHSSGADVACPATSGLRPCGAARPRRTMVCSTTSRLTAGAGQRSLQDDLGLLFFGTVIVFMIGSGYLLTTAVAGVFLRSKMDAGRRQRIKAAITQVKNNGPRPHRPNSPKRDR